MQASCWDSGTRRVLPTAPKISSVCVRWSALAWVPAEMTDMASSTRAGVFVMTRTTRVPGARRSSKKAVGMSAARW